MKNSSRCRRIERKARQKLYWIAGMGWVEEKWAPGMKGSLGEINEDKKSAHLHPSGKRHVLAVLSSQKHEAEEQEYNAWCREREKERM